MSQHDPSDRTDEPWDLIRAFVPPDRSGSRPRKVAIRPVIDAI